MRNVKQAMQYARQLSQLSGVVKSRVAAEIETGSADDSETGEILDLMRRYIALLELQLKDSDDGQESLI